MPSFLLPSYWFSLQLPEVTRGPGFVFLIIFLVLLIVGLVLRAIAMQKQNEKYGAMIVRRFVSLCFTMAVLGLFLSFFGFERVRFFGARFWYPIWVVITVLWFGLNVWFMKKRVPGMRMKEKERLEREKYMPGKKK